MFDYLIVGAGLAGCVLAEQISTHLNQRVLLVDLREHIGGNCYDYYNDDGILVHKYGPHWFHTNAKHVFDYLSTFTQWRFHFHRVRSSIDGMLLPIPINMDTLNQLYGLNLQTPAQVQAYLDRVREPIANPANAEEMVLSRVGRDLYTRFFRGYTLKQWNCDPRRLEASVTARIPVYINRDDRYFQDTYQAMPLHGYTRMMQRMLAAPNISILLNTDYRTVLDCIKFNRLIYTGPIDSFFDFAYGHLPYRSLRFEHETHEVESYQPVQQVNYPNNYDFTRVIEWKHATGQRHSKTTITREYPCDPTDDCGKYYPVPTVENGSIYQLYKAEAEKLQSVHFLGRLAEYRYLNMDQVIARALHLFETQVAPIATRPIPIRLTPQRLMSASAGTSASAVLSAGA